MSVSPMIVSFYGAILCRDKKINQRNNIITIKNYCYYDGDTYEFTSNYGIFKESGTVIFISSKSRVL